MSLAVPETEPTVRLLQRFCEDWLNAADATVCTEIMRQDYAVQIGGIVLTGLAAYVPATLGQLEQFAGLRIVVHDLVSNGRQLALHFTEHGPSVRDGGREAAWRGVALFEVENGLLVRNITEEDYFSRRRQLTDGVLDALPSALPHPWSTAVQPADPSAERRVRDWLGGGGLSTSEHGLVFDEGGDYQPLLQVERTTVTELFSAGAAVGFRVEQCGRYQRGLGLPDDRRDREGTLSTVGLVRVAPDGSIAGQMVRDRAGLRRALTRN